MGALPALCGCANDDDVQTKRCVAFALNNVSANEKNHVVCERLGVIKPLVKLVCEEDPDTHLQACIGTCTLCNCTKDHMPVSLRKQVPFLLSHFSHFISIGLRNLAQNTKNRKRMGEMGAIPAVLKFADSDNTEVLRECAACLRNVSHLGHLSLNFEGT